MARKEELERDVREHWQKLKALRDEILDLPEQPKADVNIGLFGAVLDFEKGLLLKQRTFGKYAGEWDLPGGALTIMKASAAQNERIVGEVLREYIKNQTGLEIEIDSMPPLYPAVLAGGTDWAFVALITKWWGEPGEGTMWVVPSKFRELAEGPEGARILSGFSKRMSRLCLRPQVSRDNFNRSHRQEAIVMLQEIQANWK